jgi:hypothetical protein
MHDTPGGLATSWRRGDYTFETCLHWLLGSHPKAPMYSRGCMVGHPEVVAGRNYARGVQAHGCVGGNPRNCPVCKRLRYGDLGSVRRSRAW